MATGKRIPVEHKRTPSQVTLIAILIPSYDYRPTVSKWLLIPASLLLNTVGFVSILLPWVYGSYWMQILKINKHQIIMRKQAVFSPRLRSPSASCDWECAKSQVKVSFSMRGISVEVCNHPDVQCTFKIYPWSYGQDSKDTFSPQLYLRKSRALQSSHVTSTEVWCARQLLSIQYSSLLLLSNFYLPFTDGGNKNRIRL